LPALIAGDGLMPEERLDVYRNNVLASLTAALKGTFPVVCRLVDERFFAYATQEFIRMSPPGTPCLAEYGDAFADFLATFSPCRELVYLADVARLEWALHCAAHAPEARTLALADLQQVPAVLAPRLTFRPAPSYTYLASPWPVDRIWRVNRAEVDDESVALDAGGLQVEIRRQGGEVEMRRLPPGDFAFRRTLASGRLLAAAIEAALVEDETFAVGSALAGLIEDGALSAMTIAEGEDE
jgi:hypothetical protein